LLYEEVTAKHDKLERKYQDLIERYNEVVGKQKLGEAQVKELKSRLRSSEEERDRYQN